MRLSYLGLVSCSFPRTPLRCAYEVGALAKDLAGGSSFVSILSSLRAHLWLNVKEPSKVPASLEVSTRK